MSIVFFNYFCLFRLPCWLQFKEPSCRLRQAPTPLVIILASSFRTTRPFWIASPRYLAAFECLYRVARYNDLLSHWPQWRAVLSVLKRREMMGNVQKMISDNASRELFCSTDYDSHFLFRPIQAIIRRIRSEKRPLLAA